MDPEREHDGASVDDPDSFDDLAPGRLTPTSGRSTLMPLRHGNRTTPLREREDKRREDQGRSKTEVVPVARLPEPTISPRMTAVFGGLFGLATVASIVALLIQVFPVENQRAIAAQAGSEEPQEGSSEPQPEEEVGPKKRERKLLPSPWRISELDGKHKIVDGVMERRSFIRVLKDAGVPKSEVYRVLKAMEGVREFDRTGRNDEFFVALDGTKKVMAFEYVVSPFEIYQARTGDDGLLQGQKLDMKVAENEYAGSFYIGKDFQKSYRWEGFEEGLEAEINRAFSGRTSVEAFEEGGTVKLLAVEKTALGRFVDYARIKAIEYTPPDPSKDPLRAYWFEGERFKGYVDAKGRRQSHKGWRSPCPGAPITSHFNPKRMHPVLNRVMPHNGTDFGAPAGTPVYAANRGTIALVGRHGASGNLVLIDHPGGVQTGYAHLSRFADGVKKGDKVGTRQLIGYVGSTGRSTGPHLHFSAKRGGKFFNAVDLKLDALTLMPVSERGSFMQQKQALDQALEALPTPEPLPAPKPEPVPEPEPAVENASTDREEQAPTEPEPSSDVGASGDDEDIGGDDLLGADLTDIE